MDPKLRVLEDLSHFKKQEASNNFRLGFALSRRPHLHRAYLVTVCRVLIMTVYVPVAQESFGKEEKRKVFGLKLVVSPFLGQRISLHN